jgi:hypothetical protein
MKLRPDSRCPGLRVVPPILVAFLVSALPARAEFADVTEIAGIRFVHNNGSSGQHYFEETVGSGCCWID